jgi:ABC-type multidrug transport system fused ATPase/permease subunit
MIFKKSDKEEETNKEETNKEETNKESSINLLNSLMENYPSFLCMLIAIYILSYDNFLLGLCTFIVAIYISYIQHRDSHKVKNIYSIIHHYHHENNDYLSHISQIILELTSLGIFYPLYLFFDTIFLNPWILMFFIIFYSSVHNINYSLLRVNNVHYLHHLCTNTNIGPDICDILYNTKNPSDITVENTDHYIPNIIVASIIILILQYYWKFEDNKKLMINMLSSILLVFLFILIIISIYLWNEHIKNNTENDKSNSNKKETETTKTYTI